MDTLRLRQTCPRCGAVHFATQCHICKRPVIAPQELAELQALHLSLPHLSTRPWREIETDSLIIGCLRNTLTAKKRAQAERDQRARLEAVNFELTS